MRNKNLIVYGSSYDRGLEHLLRMWPDIKKEVPDAELHVFYGWNLFDVAYPDNPERKDWKERMNELMKQPGITHLGRISHEAVKKEFETAAVWAYPTHFGEISCITAMKAQAYGAVPCVIDYGALKETVQFGVKIKGDIYDPETKELYKNSLIALMNDWKYQEEVRKEMIPWALNKFSWELVAKEWTEEFKTPMTEERKLELDVERLMEDNQSLKAWDLVKDTNYEIKDRVWLRVKHAFNPEDYKKYYSELLNEQPYPEEVALDCTLLGPRFKWLIEKIDAQKPKTALDLGCADGYTCLTLARKGIEAKGINLYAPSVLAARERASKFKLPATFEVKNLFDVKDKAEAVILFEVLEHLPDPQKAIDHCMGLVKPGGRFYLSTPSTDHIGIEQHKREVGHKAWDADLSPTGHLRVFTLDEIKQLFKGYKVEEIGMDSDRSIIVEASK
jgi:2-polyprenyl-3-methyl-5-hydroxy-6-metoxy-1,4-benzoquinol methylase